MRPPGYMVNADRTLGSNGSLGLHKYSVLMSCRTRAFHQALATAFCHYKLTFTSYVVSGVTCRSSRVSGQVSGQRMRLDLQALGFLNGNHTSAAHHGDEFLFKSTASRLLAIARCMVVWVWSRNHLGRLPAAV
ncbi:hypothetical protein PLICRDRAFT_549768 [Plicaturopsis crispa FD-325 SS-3]|nr:hypothetical protein PLICRDRAFT_549768 [Plicaturopsis crispa FD-325 SS-3]